MRTLDARSRLNFATRLHGVIGAADGALFMAFASVDIQVIRDEKQRYLRLRQIAWMHGLIGFGQRDKREQTQQKH